MFQLFLDWACSLVFPARFLHDQLGAEVKPRVRKIESYDQFTETYHVKT